ncbi:MAG: DsbA family protein [Anaerolineaceae bacterium]|nr:DsbA family protein [Anaerolineaceae bacterium]
MSPSLTRAKHQALQNKNKNKRRKNILTTTIVIFGTSLLVGFLLLPALPTFKYNVGQVELPTQYERPMISGDWMGTEDAPVTVEEYSSFDCNYCGNFALSYEEYFIQHFVAEGLVRWKFIPVTYQNPSLILASKANYCAMEQGKFWEYRDVVFANQGTAQFYPYTEKSLTSFALALELEQDSFEACLTGISFDQKLYENESDIIDINITGTPSFLINGEKLVVGANPQELLTAIESYLNNSGN